MLHTLCNIRFSNMIYANLIHTENIWGESVSLDMLHVTSTLSLMKDEACSKL